MQKAVLAELLGTLLFQFFVGFSKHDALASGVSYTVLRAFLVPALLRGLCHRHRLMLSRVSLQCVTDYSLHKYRTPFVRAQCMERSRSRADISTLR